MRSPVRDARVGDHLPRRVVDRARARRLEATAVLLPGAGQIDAYREQLEGHAGEFADWDGRVLELDADGASTHRLLVVDRYGQVYAVHDAADPRDLPDAAALREWFRFLSTACPECGVLDQPVLVGPTP
jgi:hypothetical protein